MKLTDRQEKLADIGRVLTNVELECVAHLIETKDEEGGWGYNSDVGSFWETSTGQTLSALAQEFRNLKRK